MKKSTKLSDRLDGVSLMVCVAGVNSASMTWFGYDQGVFSGVLIADNFIDLFPQTNEAGVSGIVSSCFSLGAFFGAILTYFYGDKIGRKKTLCTSVAINLVGTVLQVTSWSLAQLIIGRTINGFGMGVTSATCPSYQSECSKSHYRGRLVAIQPLCSAAAFCLANWLNYALFFRHGAFQWRFPLAFQLIFPCIIIVVLPFVPESPRWLMRQDRHDEAFVIIERLNKRSHHSHREKEDVSRVVKAEFNSIRAAIEQERSQVVPMADMLRGKDETQCLRRILLASGGLFMSQFSGVNALGYYLPTVLQQDLGYSQERSRLLTAVNGTVYLIAAGACLAVIDHVGRRKMMLYGASAMGTCYMIVAMTLLGAEQNPALSMTLGRVTTAFFFLYYFTYGTSFSKAPTIYNTELNSLGWWSNATAFAPATNWLGGFIVTLFTKSGVNNLGWGFFLMFACFCWAYLPIIYCFYPETSRRTLEDMDMIFVKYPGLIVCGKPDLTGRGRPRCFVDAEEARIAGRTERGSAADAASGDEEDGVMTDGSKAAGGQFEHAEVKRGIGPGTRMDTS